MSEHLKVGFGRKDITPPIGGSLYGYRPDIVSTSVNDSLRVTAIALCQGNTQVLLISAELCVIQSDLANRIRQQLMAETGVPHVILTVIHTHSGPNTGGAAGWGDIDQKYCDEIFIPRLLEAARQAMSSLKDVVLAVGTAQSKVGINRRQQNLDGTISLGQNPWGCFDDCMTVLRFTEPCGAPVVTLVHYGAHCTAAGPNTEITRDWAGIMLDRLETESGAPAVFINGAFGNVGPRLSNGDTTGDLSHARELGGIAALDAICAWRNAKFPHQVHISIVTGYLALPVKPRLPRHEAQKRWNMTKEGEVNIAAQKRQYYKNILDAYQKNLPEETHWILPQTIVALGNVVLVPFPFEIFSELSLRLRYHSAFEHTLCIGAANGYERYLPSQEQLCRGGYEVEMFQTGRIQPLADNTEDTIIKENLKLMEGLRCTE